MSDESILDDLKRFDGEYVAEAAFAPGLDTLANGTYDFEIISATLGRTKNSADPIIRINLRVNGGLIVEWGTLLTGQERCNRLGADLQILGFDSDKWRGTRPFSKELGLAVPKLKGIKFRAMKRSNDGKDGKTYHELLLYQRLTASSPAAGSPPATPRNGTPMPKPPQQQPAGAASDSESIPF